MVDGRPEVLSYGGGRQTVAMCILIARGVLPRPDRIVIADTGRENPSTWEYLDRYVRPLLAPLGLEVEVAPHTLATVDLYGRNGDLLMPVYTDTGKLPTYCSNEWKARVVQRHLRGGGVAAACFWIGYALDETWRVKREKPGPWFKRYPLVELCLSKENCRGLIEKAGWPVPEVSSCFMCPHKRNPEWKVIRDRYPDAFAEACRIDEEIREHDREGGGSGVWIHPSRVPLREADLDAPEAEKTSAQCTFGTCFV